MRQDFLTTAVTAIFYNYSKSNYITPSEACSKFAGGYYIPKGNGLVFAPQLFPYTFDKKLYEGVQEGSDRYWLLKRREFDYEFKMSIGKRSTVTKKEIDIHELDWCNKVSDFYTKNGDIPTSTKGEAKQASYYSLRKDFDKDKAISLVDAAYAGFGDDRKTPKYYKVLYDKEGNIIEVKINVDWTKIHQPKAVALSKCWWEYQRICYDKGDEMHPLGSGFGEKRGDWRGIVYKLQNNLNGNEDLIKYHERGWISWVHYVYNNFNTISEEKDYFMENADIISSLNEEEVREVAETVPEFLLDYISPKYYRSLATTAIDKILDNYILTADMKRDLEELSSVVGRIKIYTATPTLCDSISVKNIQTIATSLSEFNILGGLLTNITLYGLLSLSDQQLFSQILANVITCRKIHPTVVGGEGSIFDGIEWLTKENSLTDYLEGEEKRKNLCLLKYGLHA